MKELHKVDKQFNNKESEDVKNLITKTKNADHKEDINKALNKELDAQQSSFKKKLEAKKKKWQLNSSDIANKEDKSEKHLVTINHDKKNTNLNKSFDAIGKDESIFINDVSIEPISMFNPGDTNMSLTDGINNNLEFFFNDFDNLFNEKITRSFIEQDLDGSVHVRTAFEGEYDAQAAEKNSERLSRLFNRKNKK